MSSRNEAYTQSAIAAQAALDIIKRSFAEAKKREIAITVSVVGPSLEPIVFASMDGATPHSRETSRKKAQTAASTRRPTGWMPPELAIELPLASSGLLTNVPGGFPIMIDGVVIGGLGIAGGTVEQDAEIAQAALAAFCVAVS
ncbi:GlcG/HbpS family heme-binding protein [Ciceribacter selenitireducens]